MKNSSGMVAVLVLMWFNAFSGFAGSAPDIPPMATQTQARLEMGIVTNIVRLYFVGSTKEAVQLARTCFKEMKSPAAKQELWGFLDILGGSIGEDRTKELDAFLNRYKEAESGRAAIAEPPSAGDGQKAALEK